ncbi:hypothetical protein TRFO_28044 [Tritrichomonas foetus]|uniref:RRM domain-containing protein n=1 Tax=Tritrichomonas foetus TaxID=1144522 RepID=A0A1J4JZ96_9EUKA|nr:hypothetical protein TRFO_28044 [Tritrichomonas foetus]|eukprot:OHT04481.1 hypothetical protein TRFO_28044 [Tritrichomonas foetus]
MSFQNFATMHNENKTNSFVPSTNIFINYIPKEFTKRELVSLCSPFGRILSAKVMIDLLTGVSKCFGFVRFESLDSAALAVIRLNGLFIGNKKLLVRFAGSKENTGSISCSIFVRSLCLYYSEKDIWNIFSKFGRILGIELHHDDERTKLFNGAATITYSCESEAEDALREMNNMKLTNDSWPLFIRYTQQSAKNANDNIILKDGIKIVKPKRTASNNSINNKGSNSNNGLTSSGSLHSGFKSDQTYQFMAKKTFDDPIIPSFPNSISNDDYMFSMLAEEL